MHLVVAARVPSPPEVAASRLVELQGLSLYEARARLAGDPPRLLATIASADEAASLSRALGAAGFLAFRIDGSAIESERGRDRAASLTFEPDALVGHLRDGRERRLPWASVRLVLRGMRTSQNVSTKDETVSRFSPGKALLTGGLITQTKTTTSTKVTQTSRQGFAYVYDEQGSPPLAIYEQQMSYAFLGPRVQPSSLANFNAVVALLRERAPRARYDDRLQRAPLIGAVPLSPPGVDPEEWKVDIACTVLSAADAATH